MAPVPKSNALARGTCGFMGTAAPKYAGHLGAVELNATFHDRGNATYDSQAFKGRCPCVPGVPRVVLNSFYALALTPYGCTEIATSSFMEMNTDNEVLWNRYYFAHCLLLWHQTSQISSLSPTVYRLSLES